MIPQTAFRDEATEHLLAAPVRICVRFSARLTDLVRSALRLRFVCHLTVRICARRRSPDASTACRGSWSAWDWIKQPDWRR